MKSYNQGCPIASALDLLGERWTLLIIRELLRGRSKFSEIQEALPGIAPNLLSGRLRALEEGGVLARTLTDDRSPKPRYALTEAGEELWIPLRAIGLWGTRHAQRRFKRVHDHCGHELEAIIYCRECDAELDDTETSMRRR